MFVKWPGHFLTEQILCITCICPVVALMVCVRTIWRQGRGDLSWLLNSIRLADRRRRAHRLRQNGSRKYMQLHVVYPMSVESLISKATLTLTLSGGLAGEECHLNRLICSIFWILNSVPKRIYLSKLPVCVRICARAFSPWLHSFLPPHSHQLSNTTQTPLTYPSEHFRLWGWVFQCSRILKISISL